MPAFIGWVFNRGHIILSIIYLFDYVHSSGKCDPNLILFCPYETYIRLFHSSPKGQIPIFSPPKNVQIVPLLYVALSRIHIWLFWNHLQSERVVFYPTFLSLMWAVHHNSALEETSCCKTRHKQWLKIRTMKLWKICKWGISQPNFSILVQLHIQTNFCAQVAVNGPQKVISITCLFFLLASLMS